MSNSENGSTKIKEFATVYDGPHATPKKTKSGPYYLGINAITEDGRIDLNASAHLSKDDYIKWTKRITPQKNDIVFSYEATLGRYAMIPAGFIGSLGRRLAIVRVNSELVNPRWLYYYFYSPTWKKYMANRVVYGSTVNRISVDEFPEYEVELIDRKKQDDIVDILSAIDDMISNNEAIAQQLEAMAKTIYDYWFLQFEFPNEEGKPYKSSGGKMVWNEELQREIPAGWGVADLVNNPLTKLIKPGIKKFSGTKRYLATADVNGTSYSAGSNITFDNRESRANMQPTLNSIWFAKMKDSIKHLYLNKELNSIIEETILSTGFCGIQCDEHSFEYLASFIESDYFEKVKNQLAHGATQQAVNNVDLQSVKLVIPSEKVVDKFHEVTKSMFSLISKNKVENTNLTALRDFLLPLLMNGQVSVGEKE